MQKLLVTLALCAYSIFVTADENIKPITIDSYTHAGNKYPPVFFVTNIEDGEFKQSLEKFDTFEELNEEAIGLPIGIRVIKGFKQKMDGASFSSLMLSAGTLGLTPIVNNKEFRVRYDVFVQGDSIFRVDYAMDTTDVSSLYSTPNAPRDLKPAEQHFIEQSIPQFLHDLQKETSVKDAFNEYFYYFGSTTQPNSP